jgi:hypothetical protein
MSKFTFNKLIEFNEIAKRYFASHKQENDFTRCLERNIEIIRPHFEGKGGYNERANKINRATAAKDSKNKGVLLTDNRGVFLYTEAGLQRRDDEMNLLGEELIEIENEFCYDIPDDLTIEHKMILRGIIIDDKITVPEYKMELEKTE